ncbi:expressed unknown protein [Seminavis robusta]|uniref:Uncharacterized protein n=1 Tax=Seminavis robusta TaxID=568900 RepID=A0A9N8DBC5_9STRA|nr:expressed unknown protein [Seminavis robusta]|eukprot:Sro64_g036220.1 n/a (312) ;mRNA; f:45065-46000
MYSGAWTAEEQRYVTALIEEFHAGNLPGVKERTSLRKLLASKLGCHEKRITKKYERTGYNGRKQYVPNVMGFSRADSERRLHRLQELELSFRRSREHLINPHAAISAMSAGQAQSQGITGANLPQLQPRQGFGVALPRTGPIGASSALQSPPASAYLDRMRSMYNELVISQALTRTGSLQLSSNLRATSSAIPQNTIRAGLPPTNNLVEGTQHLRAHHGVLSNADILRSLAAPMPSTGVALGLAASGLRATTTLTPQPIQPRPSLTLQPIQPRPSLANQATLPQPTNPDPRRPYSTAELYHPRPPKHAKSG